MENLTRIQLRLANDLIASRIEEAANARRHAETAPSIRRSIGRSFIRLGERLAAEPNLQPAGSR